MSKFFEINVNQYVKNKSFIIYRPASLDHAQDHAVMFVTEGFLDRAESLNSVKNCLVFWPMHIHVPKEIIERHAVVLCENPHLAYCAFFQDNHITNHPKRVEYDLVDGAYIAKGARIGNHAVIFPNVYIDEQVEIGNNVFIGFGSCLIGRVIIGDDVVIRENTVIGADGLSTDRGENGKAITMPQFGGVKISNNVCIGANTVIARGAIDDTVIHDGCKIDNSCFISHNVQIGSDTFVVGETIMFGSSSTGEQAYISGNSTIRNGIHVGSKAIVGMGTVVTKPVADGVTVLGNPARMR